MVKRYIQNIGTQYPTVHIDHYVIMPNHIHLLISLQNKDGRQGTACPTISDLVRVLKIMVRKESGKSIFQTSFHDHIIRGEADYLKIWNYIENNPAGWEKDCFYVE